MNKEQTERLVDQTSTFSGREIAKLMIAIQGAAYSVEHGNLTSKMVDEVVLIKVSDHKEKRKMFRGVGQVEPPKIIDTGKYSACLKNKEERHISLIYLILSQLVPQ